MKKLIVIVQTYFVDRKLMRADNVFEHILAFEQITTSVIRARHACKTIVRHDYIPTLKTSIDVNNTSNVSKVGIGYIG